MDDQNNLNYCLSIVSSLRGFNNDYRKAAEEWITEIG